MAFVFDQSGRWLNANLQAARTYEEAIKYLDALSDEAISTIEAIGGIDDVEAYLGEVTNLVSAYNAPTPPTVTTVDSDFPVFNETLETTPVDPFVTPDPVPEFTATEPVINEAVAPARFTKTAPQATPVQEFEYPDTPNEALPTAPVLRDLVLPTKPTVIDIAFTGLLPEDIEAAPDVTFSYAESDYSTSLLDEVNAKLLEYVSGFSTGLKPDVEEAIWNRARDRTAATSERIVTNESRLWGASGWTLVGGDLVEKVSQAEKESAINNMTESRSIAIAQAELEQKNFQFSFTQAVQLEGVLISHSDNVNQRLFEAAKYQIQAAIDVYGLKVTRFNAQIEAYGIQARVYSDRIKAELTKIELYKAELDGVRLISELNAQDIANYKAQIDAVLALFELYKSELEGVKIKLDGERLKIQAFESEIKAFESEVRAKGIEYEGYKTETEAELNKVKIYEAQADVFNSRIEAFKSLVEAESTKKEVELKINQEIPVEVYKTKSETYQIRVSAEAERLKAQLGELEVAASIYDSQVKGETARVDAEVSVQKNEIDKLVAYANVRIESFKANITKALSIAELISAELQTGARVAAQLAASAMSVINLSDSTGYSESSSISNSKSNSTSLSESHTHIYNET